MDNLLLDIVNELRSHPGLDHLDSGQLSAIIGRYNKGRGSAEHYSKRKILPYYFSVKSGQPDTWAEWAVDPEMETRLVRTLRMKPRRTASGVSTITVLTKPWKCSNACLYCPNDVRMPKSYLRDEPACQRAEQNFFDPYLQVRSRLRMLHDMGHITDKVELIVLGGTWNDYPEDYQIWFITQLFVALNDTGDVEAHISERRAWYETHGISADKAELSQRTDELQAEVSHGAMSYNQAIMKLYTRNDAWKALAEGQRGGFDELERQQVINETAAHRAVGLVVETRPDVITVETLATMRRLGCTKIQMGIQSLNPEVLAMNNRTTDVASIRKAFELVRLFGFKIHAHFMLNLYGSTPDKDKQDYLRFVTEAPYLPDEVKLYPCALVTGTALCSRFDEGVWRPYTYDELLDLLSFCVLATPGYTRISRMFRDISAHDIVTGNTKTNIREDVEAILQRSNEPVKEIRYREISGADTAAGSLTLNVVPYETTVTQEYFLQWVTAEDTIAGFLRLSLPKTEGVNAYPGLPIAPREAMIREVHVYGKVAALNAQAGDNVGAGVQHLGLGKRLIELACDLARDHGFTVMNVISSVGTREYYRHRGFEDAGLYQRKPL